jgi:hypothetical protein
LTADPGVGVLSPTDLSARFPEVWKCREIRYTPGDALGGGWRFLTAVKRVIDVIRSL